MCIFINLKRLEKKRLNVSCVTAEHEIVKETVTFIFLICCCQRKGPDERDSLLRQTKWSISITATSSSMMIGNLVMIWTMAYDHCRDRRLRICLPFCSFFFVYSIFLYGWTNARTTKYNTPTLNDHDGWEKNLHQRRRRHGKKLSKTSIWGKTKSNLLRSNWHDHYENDF